LKFEWIVFYVIRCVKNPITTAANRKNGDAAKQRIKAAAAAKSLPSPPPFS
jgi:hypothetical protein